MGAQNSKRKDLKNINDEDYAHFMEKLKKHTDGKDKMTRDQFVVN